MRLYDLVSALARSCVQLTERLGEDCWLPREEHLVYQRPWGLPISRPPASWGLQGHTRGTAPFWRATRHDGFQIWLRKTSPQLAAYDEKKLGREAMLI